MGIAFQRSIEKNGIENFTKTILEYFTSAEAMYAREKEVVTEEFLNRDDTYNLRRGGRGGFDHIHRYGLCDYVKAAQAGNERMQHLRETNPDWVSVLRDTLSAAQKRRACIEGSRQDHMKEMTNKSKSAASREKRKEKFRDIEHQSGSKNSQYGSMWITNGSHTMKVKCTEDLPLGYVRGRTQRKYDESRRI